MLQYIVMISEYETGYSVSLESTLVLFLPCRINNNL